MSIIAITILYFVLISLIILQIQENKMAEIEVLRTNDESLQFYTIDGITDWSKNKYNLINDGCIIGRDISFVYGTYGSITAENYKLPMTAITINSVFSFNVNDTSGLALGIISPDTQDVSVEKPENLSISVHCGSNSIRVKCQLIRYGTANSIFWNIDQSYTIENDTKYQVTLTWDRWDTSDEAVKLYINSELIATTSSTFPSMNPDLDFATDDLRIGYNEGGTIYNLSIYDEVKDIGWITLNNEIEGKYTNPDW